MSIDRYKRALLTCIVVCLAILSASGTAEDRKYDPIDLWSFNDSIQHWLGNQARDRDDPRFEAHQIVEISDNMIQYQNPDGGWPKNLDWLSDIDYETVKRIFGRGLKRSTFDNRTTYSHVDYLAKVYAVTGHERFRKSADKGLDYILKEQRASGGWRGSDVDGITFNDDVMTGIMNLLLDIHLRAERFDWLGEEKRDALDESLQRAIEATLRCQIVVDGNYTAWCQQHSHDTYAPIKARSYELVSITPAESTEVVRFLMRLPEPGRDLQERIRGAVEWMQRSAIRGIRTERKSVPPVRESYRMVTEDMFVIEDPSAPLIWTRYYEVNTNRPFFCNRDGIKVYSLAEVTLERRTGYAWYGTWPERLIENEYPKWETKLSQ